MISLGGKNKKMMRSIPQSDSLDFERFSGLKSVLSDVRVSFETPTFRRGNIELPKDVEISSDKEETRNSTVAEF